jgi:putative transposase
VACDFFTVETIRLKTLHVVFFIHLSTRRVVATEVTAHPDTAWVTQQARNAAIGLDDRGMPIRFLLRDHDAKFTPGFDEVFDSGEGKVVRTPIRALAPKANAYAKRWVQTVRAECLDWTLVLGRRHLLRLLHTDVRHYRGRDRTAASPWPFPSRTTGAHRRSTLQMSGVAMCSAASSTSITRSQHDD